LRRSVSASSSSRRWRVNRSTTAWYSFMRLGRGFHWPGHRQHAGAVQVRGRPDATQEAATVHGRACGARPVTSCGRVTTSVRARIPAARRSAGGSHDRALHVIPIDADRARCRADGRGR
jgi:hypothetical protein